MPKNCPCISVHNDVRKVYSKEQPRQILNCYVQVLKHCNDGKAKVNRLIEEIEDLFEQNEIDCSEDWKNYFRQAKEKVE